MKTLFIGLLACTVCVVLAGCPPLVVSNIRLVNALPDQDAPVLDACFNGNKRIENVGYPDSSEYRAMLPNTYTIRVVTAGNSCDSTALVETERNLARGTEYTLAITGRTDAKQPIAPLFLTDNNEAPPEGRSKIRFVNLSPNAGELDLVVDGQPSAGFDDIEFRENGGYRVLPAGTYDITISGGVLTENIVLENQPLVDGDIYTIFAVGLSGLTGSTLEALITLDN